MNITTILSGAALALLASTSVQADTVTSWGGHPLVKGGANIVTGSFVSFTDVYTFSLASLASTAVNASEIMVIPGVVDLAGGTVELFKGLYGDTAADTSLGAFSFNGTAGASHQYLGLTAGNYYYQVGGTTNLYGANYYIASAATMVPVPEPETLALTLAGLGLLGAMARRRKIS